MFKEIFGDTESLTSIWQWLVSGGALVSVSWFVSWAFEEVTWWHDQSSKFRSVVMLAVAGLIGFGAQYFLLHPEFIAEYQAYILGFIGTILGWVATQTAHNKNPSKKANVKKA